MPVGRTPIIDLDNHLVDDHSSWGEWVEEEWRSLLPKKIPGAADERPRTLVGDRVMMGSEIPNQRGKRPNWVGTSDHTPEGRVKLLDEAGIDMAVLSPSSSAQNFMWFPDNPKLAAAYCRAQNNYMANYASLFPDRLKWAGTIPVQDAEEAVKELRRIVPLGSVGVNLKAVPVNSRQWYDPFYDPIYEELQRLGIPIIFHDTKTGSLGEERFAENWLLSHLVAKVLEALVCCASLIFGGVLERFPELKIVIVETDTSEWPWWLSRMDEHYEMMGEQVGARRPPSEYVRGDRFFISADPEEEGIPYVMEKIGAERVVYLSDYWPYDAKFPGSVPHVNAREDLAQRQKRLYLGENAARLYNLV